jgi:lysosomal acid lipase/cholesteryl ester hydrolase
MKDLLFISDAPSLIRKWNYPVQIHTAVTKDGYHLGIHRIPCQSNSPDQTPNRNPVILWHALSTCSDIFVCTPPQESLAFLLVDNGYDVWLANTRGNKYSSSHSHLHQSNMQDRREYWKFGIDEFAMYDVPAVVDFVSNSTNSRRVSYIGFSQGAAQIIAALALDEELNSKLVHVFGLAPAMVPKPIENSIVRSMNSTAIYSVLGRNAFLGLAESVKYWNKHVNRAIVEGAMKVLFNWRLSNFGSEERRQVLAQNVFSTTSVKNIAVICD